MKLEDEFWNFAAALYARPGVSEILLDWQDRRGVNVNLVLLAIWAASRGRRLDPTAFGRAENAIAGWQAAAVEPLRMLRRRLKSDWSALARDSEATRQAILTAELQAERAAQALMLAALEPWPAAGSAASAQPNLNAYLGEAAARDISALLAAIG